MRMGASAGLGILMMAAYGSAWAQTASPEPAASSAPAEDIRDIRGPKSDLAQAPVLPVAVATVCLLVVGYGVWRWRRSRRRTTTWLPFELALQQLDQARGMMRTEAGREFGAVVSDIVRHYLERQFNVTVTRRTTEEFMQGLMSAVNTPLARQRPLLAEFLAQSDLIKFAGGSLALQDLEALLQRARRLVQETAHAGNAHDSIPAA
jgi:hypothetical protein